MKKFLLILFLGNLNAQQYNLEVYEINPTQREGLFQLKDKKQHVLADLDCFSFITGVTLNNLARDRFFLYPTECEEVLNLLDLWTRNDDYGCLFLDFTGQDWSIDKACNN